MTPSPEGMHGAFDEPTITVDWGLKLSEEAHANLFKRIRNHFEQATAIVDDVKEKRKYRLSEDDLLLIRNLMALWDQIKTFCQARMSNFNDFNDALVNTNHKDGDLREILDQRPIHYAMSMMPSAREAALKEVKALEESATMEVEKQRQEVRQARWKFFQTALEKDQKTLLQLAGAPAKLEVMRHRKVMAWRLDQAKKGEKIVQSYMAKYLTTEFVEKVEHAQQKVNEFRAAVAPRLQSLIPTTGSNTLDWALTYLPCLWLPDSLSQMYSEENVIAFPSFTCHASHPPSCHLPSPTKSKALMLYDVCLIICFCWVALKSVTSNGMTGQLQASTCECALADVHMVSIVDLNVPFAKAKENMDELCRSIQFVNDLQPATHCALVEIPQIAKKCSRRGLADEEMDLQQKLWSLRQVCDDRWILPFDVQPSAESKTGKPLGW